MWLRKWPVLLLVALLAGCEKPTLPSPFHAGDAGVMFTQADFRLTDQTGKTRTLADFRGKVVALFFGYTHCQDVCITTLADMAQVMQQLGNDADKLQVLFITVDPERDTPEVMARYVSAFHPSFLGLSGDTQATQQAAKAFYIGYEKRPTSSGYNMDHSVGTFLVDPSGKVRLRAPLAQRTDWLTEDIRLLLGGA